MAHCMNIQRVQVIARGLVQRSIGFRARLQPVVAAGKRIRRTPWSWRGGDATRVVSTRYIRSVTQRR